MKELVIDALQVGLLGVLTFVLAMSKDYVIEWLKHHTENIKAEIDSKNLTVILNLAKEAVRAAEQLLELNEDKKDFAIEEVRKKAKEMFNIDLTYDQIDMFIESAVKELKNVSGLVFNELEAKTEEVKEGSVEKWDL